MVPILMTRFPSNGVVASSARLEIDQFQKRMVALGISVAELARRTGMGKADLAKVLAGKAPLTRRITQIVEKLERSRG